MKRTAGYLTSVLALLAFAFGTSAMAETVSTALLLSPANEVPPIPGLNAQGVFQITVNVTRDANGAITGGSVRFLGSVSFPGAVTITGLHIHEGIATANGGVVIGTSISASSPVVFAAGSGIIDLTVQNPDPAVLTRLLAKPAGFYVNLHTSVNQGGAIRGQLIRFEERQAITVTMTTANEVPPVTTESGTGVATITATIERDDKGVITGGSVTFSMQYDFTAPITLRGLHIHEGAAGVNGSVRIDTGLSGSNTVTLPNGKGSANFIVPIIPAGPGANLEPFRRMIADPTGFYVNLHSALNTGGVVRAQLAALSSTPPIIHQSDTYFIEAGSGDFPVKILATGVDLASVAVVNGTPVVPVPDLSTGQVTVNIPAAARANAGVIFLQARNGQGLMSTPIQIVVAAAANVNTTAATTVDAAKFSNLAAPDSVAAAFGTKLASTTVSATVQPLPTSLDGTTVYVNGVPARLFFVSTEQVNYLVPAGTPAGPTSVVIVAKDGTVSRGTVNVSASAPGIFTRTANGLGAPSAVASADGMIFNIFMANPDGTPVAIDAGNFVALFGTGFRFASTPMTMTIGGTNVTVLFAGAQPTFAGLDQANIQIPQSLAGRGDVDLVLTIDGKTSNTVKLRIK